MKQRSYQMQRELFERLPELLPLKPALAEACGLLLGTFRAGGKLLVCGNGGSSADSDHIVGELMKGFLLRRPLSEEEKAWFAPFGEAGARMSGALQGGLPAISLSAHAALGSAFANDVDPSLVYAQQVWGYARPGDLVMTLSTSGNAENVCYAAMAARARGAKTVALTGRDGGRLAPLCDCALIAPEKRTFRIQEYHLALYHYLCAFVESELFEV